MSDTQQTVTPAMPAERVLHPAPVQIWTDGGCSPNPGPGGWAAILCCKGTERELSGGEVHTTNNRMELMAAISALEALTRPCKVVLHTDSQYVCSGMTSWVQDWLRRNWRNAKGKPVENVDLWQRLLAASQRHQVTWQWVKAHSGNSMNDRVDLLVMIARDKVETEPLYEPIIQPGADKGALRL